MKMFFFLIHEFGCGVWFVDVWLGFFFKLSRKKYEQMSTVVSSGFRWIGIVLELLFVEIGIPLWAM
jgi:hypothetical protein